MARRCAARGPACWSCPTRFRGRDHLLRDRRRCWPTTDGPAVAARAGGRRRRARRPAVAHRAAVARPRRRRRAGEGRPRGPRRPRADARRARPAAVHLGDVGRAEGRPAPLRRADPRRRDGRSGTSGSAATTGCSSRRRSPTRPASSTGCGWRSCSARPQLLQDRSGTPRRAGRAAPHRRDLRPGRHAVPGRPGRGRRGRRARARARCGSSSPPAPRCRARWPSTRPGPGRGGLRRLGLHRVLPGRRSPRRPTSPRKRWGTDGRALAAIRIRVTDDAGTRARPGRRRATSRSSAAACSRATSSRPDLTAAALTPDGWYRTGDLATIDERGFLRITGRVTDVVNRGGEKIPVAEIEQLLHRHPAVEDVAIVAMPDPRLGERACAFVVDAGRRPTFAGRARVPRRPRRRQAVLAGAARARRRAPRNASRQGPEVRAARAAAGLTPPPRRSLSDDPARQCRPPSTRRRSSR